MSQSGIILPVYEKTLDDDDFETILVKSIHHIKNTVHNTLEDMLLEEVRKHPASRFLEIECRVLEERVNPNVDVKIDNATLSQYCAEWCVQNFVKFEEVKRGSVYGFFSGNYLLFRFELRCDILSIINGTHCALYFYQRIRDTLEKLSRDIQKAFERVVLEIVKRRDYQGFESKFRVLQEPIGWSSYSVTADYLLSPFRFRCSCPTPDRILAIHVTPIVAKYASILQRHGIKMRVSEPEPSLCGIASYSGPKVIFTLDFSAGGVGDDEESVESWSPDSVDTVFGEFQAQSDNIVPEAHLAVLSD